MSCKKSRVLLAIASGGGHWVQLLRLRKAFAGNRVHFVTTIDGYQRTLVGDSCFIIRDASRNDKYGLMVMLIQLVGIFIRVRPDIVITTGAAPGVLAVRLGKLFGARTLWLDSIANAEEMSLSGRLAGPYADLWLTQWPELEKEGGPLYKGQIL